MRARVWVCAPSGGSCTLKATPNPCKKGVDHVYQNTIPSTTHDGVLKVAAEAETLLQTTAVVMIGRLMMKDFVLMEVP